jgi:predicted Holliday junction resolvase-like endonuclease
MDLINITFYLFLSFLGFVFYTQKKELNFLIKKINTFKVKEAQLENKILELNKEICAFSLLNDQLKTSLNKGLLNFKDEKSSLEKHNLILTSEISDLKKSHQKDLKDLEKKTREDTLKRSRSILRGQASEHLAPYVIKDTNPKDYRFMGNPVDYICFDGLSDLLDKQADEIISVRFVDIKTGKSNLNKSQRRIRDAIKDGRVSFEVVNLDEVINDEQTNQ